MAKGSELVKFDASQYQVIKPERRAAIIEAIQQNIGDGGIRPIDLPRVSVPPGGGQFWVVKSLEHPNGKPIDSLDGILVYWRKGRTFWANPLGEGAGGAPPDCFSDDCIVGTGNPGGSCKQCPYAAFGSDPKGGDAQACKEKRVLFLLRPGSALPMVVMIPPSSIKNFSNYMLALASEEVPYFGIETKIGLSKAKSNVGGVDYSQVTFAPGSKVDAQTIDGIREYAKEMRAVFSGVTISDAVGGETPDADLVDAATNLSKAQSGPVVAE